MSLCGSKVSRKRIVITSVVGSSPTLATPAKGIPRSILGRSRRSGRRRSTVKAQQVRCRSSSSSSRRYLHTSRLRFSSIRSVPHLFMVLAANPKPQLLLIVVVARRLEPVHRGIELCQIEGIDSVIVGLFHKLHFFGGKARVADPLDAVVQFTDQTTASVANKCARGEVDILREFGGAFRAFAVWHQFLQGSNLVVGGHLGLAANRPLRGAGAWSTRLSQHCRPICLSVLFRVVVQEAEAEADDE